jgi:ubiquinol-cytochrome c reductase cytochrome b subunit
MLRRAVRILDERAGAAPAIRKTLRYVFPDHWSFLLGEVALYAFLVLVATGVYLTLFFEPSLATTVYHGSYAPLKGQQVSEAYKSVVDLSFDVKAGLLIRQTHHWAADVFVVSIVLHLLRVFFTGAFRRPRELTYVIGVVMLFATLVEGYLGYSLVDDLLSGMGLAIGYSTAMSVPVIGGNLGLALWGAPFPGAHAFESRMYIAHVFLLPGLIGTLIAVHLALVASRHHTQFRPRNEHRLRGVPMFPGQAPRSIALMLAVVALLLALGGLAEINPIWLWGPYHVGAGTNGAQPDWYLGWLIGALRLTPGFDVVIGGRTVIPNPFWGGILFPTIVVAVLVLWPWAERRRRGDHAVHNVLERPRDAPGRTAFGVAFLAWVFLVFVAGSADRAQVFFDLPYTGEIWFYRGFAFVAPVVIFFVVRAWCRSLQRAEQVEHRRREAEAAARALEEEAVRSRSG